MLQRLSEEIRPCCRLAEECAGRAETALAEAGRTDDVRLEQSWLELARSHQFHQRLALFENERPKRTSDAGQAIELANRTCRVISKSLAKFPGSGEAGNPIHRPTELITIVDDEDCVRGSLSILIESYGRKAATFASAEDYLASDGKRNTACLILDVNLPDMSGPALQARLIAEGRCPPTVFVTGRPERNVKKRVIAAGALAYLSKPCKEGVLLDCLEKALGGTLLVK